MRAIQISSFGNPTDVLELIDIPEPPQPDAGQALIGVEFAPDQSQRPAPHKGNIPLDAFASICGRQ